MDAQLRFAKQSSNVATQIFKANGCEIFNVTTHKVKFIAIWPNTNIKG